MAKESPVYERLKLELRARIDRGDLREGDQLPTEYDLVEESGLSRHQVRQALRELEIEGYVERSQGRGSFVAPRTTRTDGLRVLGGRPVALSFPQYGSLYARQVVEGFMRCVSEQGHQVVAYNMQFDDLSEYEFLQQIRDSGAAGLGIWLGYSNDRTRALLARHRDEGFPVVMMDRYMPGVELDYVASDHEDIGYRLTRALLERGHRDVAFVMTGIDNCTSVQDRLDGYHRALREAGIVPSDGVYIGLDFDENVSALAANAAMAVCRRPTGFVCVNDLVAQQMYRELARLGFTVGTNVEMATVDDDHVAEDCGIPMIRVVQRAFDIGVKGGELLLARIAEPGRPVEKVLFEAGPLLNGGGDARATRAAKGGGKASVSSAESPVA